jgi:serine-type D-Ala-D-Ala carboxypeptidase (penicillin-binding protein 5/6)
MNQLKTKKYYFFASFLVILITLGIYKGIDTLLFSSRKEELKNAVYLVPTTKIPVLKEKLPEKYPQATNSAINEYQYDVFAQTISAKSAYVEDVDSGTILFERNSQRILLPASTTKLMTALVVLEEFNLENVIVVPTLPKVDGLKYEFEPNEQILVQDLLKAMLIQSSNDAAYILALSSSKGFGGFVESMNQKAQELNLKQTQYKNPAGFDDDTQKSTARDLVILSKEFMQDEFLAQIVATKEAVITDVSGEFQHYLTSTHQLLGLDPTVVGIKTGTTEGASQVLITQFNREGHNIIIVVMGSEDRYLETMRLIDWVFNAYVWLDPQELIY